MDSFNYIFGLAALAYIVTSTMFAAVRWWHTCPTADKGYAYPDRRMQALLYLVPAVVLAPCVAFPMRPSAQALVAHYFVLCHSFFCALLLMTYFGRVKGWQRWKPWSVALGVPVGVMVAAKAVEAWTDVAVMPERMGWWLTATVGAVSLRYYLGTIHPVWLWMKPLSEEMGCTFSAYVNRLRLQRADELHRQEPQAPIGDIIARSGFDSPSNYYKAKRKYGEE